MLHLDELILGPDCHLADSGLPRVRHQCHVNSIQWQQDVDPLIMRTLLDCFPPTSVTLQKCRVIPCEFKKIIINSPPREMVRPCFNIL